MRNLATSLIINEKIKVTEARAKELRKHIEKLVTLGKRQNLHSRRCASNFLYDVNIDDNETVLQKLFNKIAKKYKDRNGGYTRISRLNNRKGDNSLIVIVELI